TGHRVTVIVRGVTFFESKKFIVTAAGVSELSIPAKARFVDMLDGQVIVRLSQEWAPIAAGSLASFDAAAAAKDPSHLAPTAIYQPGPRESVEDAGATR